VAVAYLLAAILFEVVATTCLKQSEGFTKLWPSVGTTLGYAVAFLLLAQSLKAIEVSVAYAVWSGVGTALITVIGVSVLGEPLSALGVAGIALIVAGVVALNLGGAH
jgi:small multidrug resistance pump